MSDEFTSLLGFMAGSVVADPSRGKEYLQRYLRWRLPPGTQASESEQVYIHAIRRLSELFEDPDSVRDLTALERALAVRLKQLSRANDDSHRLAYAAILDALVARLVAMKEMRKSEGSEWMPKPQRHLLERALKARERIQGPAEDVFAVSAPRARSVVKARPC